MLRVDEYHQQTPGKKKDEIYGGGVHFSHDPPNIEHTIIDIHDSLVRSPYLPCFYF